MAKNAPGEAKGATRDDLKNLVIRTGLRVELDTLRKNAAARGTGATVWALLDAGADPKARDASWTPLHATAVAGTAEIVCALLDAGADLEGRTGYGWAPLHLAAAHGAAATVRALLDAGANAGARSRDGSTPFDLARERGFEQIQELLVELPR